MGDALNNSRSKPISPLLEERRLQLGTSGFIFDIKKYAIHDGPGIRTTVFFKGCPLRCLWCHNPESWTHQPELAQRSSQCIRCGSCIEVCPNQAISLVEEGTVNEAGLCSACGRCADVCAAGAREIIGREMSVAEVMVEVEKDTIFYDQSGGGVTFSGGEPLQQPKFLLALLEQCRARQIHTVVDTSCYVSLDILEMISEKTNLFLCDLKHVNGAVHQRFTGVDNVLILDNIRQLAQAGKNVVIRIPIIPGFNDDRENIDATGKFIASLPGVSRVVLLAYNRGGKEKSARLMVGTELMQNKAPDDEEVNSIAANLKNYGLEVKVGG